jgi:hypothetical protein
MEGVKLDITIAEGDICNNKLTIENVEARLNKLTEDFGKVSQQLDNYRKAEIYFLNNQHRVDLHRHLNILIWLPLYAGKALL